jgi:hypothetical protein
MAVNFQPPAAKLFHKVVILLSLLSRQSLKTGKKPNAGGFSAAKRT